MSKPKAYIEWETNFNLSGTAPLDRPLQDDDVLDETYTVKLVPSEVEILFWGNTLQWIEDEVGVKKPFPITVAFCRELKTGKCLEVQPLFLHFEKDVI